MSVADQEVLVYDPELIAEKTYWVNRLAGEFAESFLILDHPRSPFYVGDTDECEVEIAGPLYERLRSLTGESPFLVYITLLAALKICLFKYSGQRRIAVGCPALMAGGASETKPNVLVIIDELDPDASFRKLLAQIRQSLLEAHERQRYPFAELAADLKRDDALNRSPFFDCALALAEIHAPLPALRNDLTLRFSDTGASLKGTAQYHRQLFTRQTIERFIGHFIAILEGATGDVGLAISRLSPLTREERQQLLVHWNQTAITYEGDGFLPHLFEAQVARSPEAVAVSDGERRLTYHELNEKANQLAHYLQSLGVGPEVSVGLLIGRSLEMVVGTLGVLKAGGAYIPLDPQSPPERLSYMLDDAQVRVLLTQQKLLASLPPMAVAHVVSLETEAERLAGQGPENPGALIEPENAAYIIYTSGSTGRPKGVVVTHSGLSNYLKWSIGSYPVAEGAATPLHTPLSFDLTVTSLFPPLISGGRVELVPELPGVEGLLKILSSPSTSSLIKLTPSHLQLLNRQVVAGHIVGRVSALVIGGEALTGEMLEIWQKEFPHTRLINEYGPTETVVGCAVYEVKGGRNIVGPTPIGRPIANTKLYVLDQYGLPVPVGVAGELYIGGEGLARGYWRRADLTAERFVPNPFSECPGDRLYRTGDLVRYLPEGDMEYLGRTDTQIKIRGHRVEPEEIEYHLRQHAAVREAAVVVKRDPHAQERLVAYVTPVEGEGEPTTRELRQFLQQRLPEYMLPTKIVSLPALPLTQHGKTDWRALPEPDWSAYKADAEQMGNPTEELLRGVWREVLGVEEIGVDDSFFALGGQSLMATQVASRVREIWGLEVEMLSLFERPTIRALGQWLDEQRRSAMGPAALKRVERVAQAGRAPLSYAQERLWFLEQLDPGSPLYTVQLPIRLHGELKLEALERSLNEIVRRHEILRTRFALEDEGPAQIVSEPEPIVFRVEDLRGRVREERDAAAREALRTEGQRGFDLQKGQLIRALILRLADDDHIACLTMHHIVCDGWSTAILVREVSQLYGAYAREETSPLPPLPVQYADYAIWQREYLSVGRLEEELAYWRRHLDGAPTLLELPTDRPRPPVQSARGAGAQRVFGAELARGVRELSQRHGVTQFMTLLSAFRIMLGRYSGQTDIVVGSPIAGRTQSETEGLIGFFINTLALRNQIRETASFTELAQQEREVCLDAYRRQELPFEKLVEELNPERKLSHAPIFQVMLVLHNMPIGILEMEDLSFSPVDIRALGAKFDLTMSLVEVGDAMTCSIEYSADLFDAATIERFMGHYQSLLQGAIADPSQSVACLPMLEDAERRQLIFEWNETAADYPQWVKGAVSIQQLFEAQARRRPTALAVEFADQRITYGELNTRANQLAGFLRDKGVGPEVRVGLWIERSIEMVVGIFGILKAGGAYVPLDPQYPRERLIFMSKDADISLMLTSESCLPEVPTGLAPVFVLDNAQGNTSDNLEPNGCGENLAYMMYTSGSTGQPKGTMISHRNLVHSTVARIIYYRDPVGACLLLVSFAFDSSIGNIFWTLCDGGTLVLRPPDFERDPLKLAELIENHRINTLICLPSLYSFLLQVGGAERLRSLKSVIVAGETCPPALVEQHYEQLPGRKFFNEFGPTEGTVWCSVAEIDGGSNPHSVSIGRPIPNVRLYILDKQGRPTPIGVFGEIHIGGNGVVRGYHNRPDLTASKFVPDPFSGGAGERLYKTGDIGRYLADGNMEFLGRDDAQLKVRGYRIELGEIESALGGHTQISAVVVTGHVGSAKDTSLIAYYVASGQSFPSSEELRAYLRDKLPEYMIPSLFMRLETLPLTPNGKVDRRALPAPNLKREEIAAPFVPPRDQLESLIAETWAEFLPVKEVGAHDNFFDLGGHSLLTIRVHDRLQKKLERSFPLLKLFEHPTVQALAGFLRDDAGAALTETVSPEDWATRRKNALRRQRLDRASAFSN